MPTLSGGTAVALPPSVMMWTRMLVCGVVLGLVSSLGLPPAHAAEGEASLASAGEVRAALSAFKKASRSKLAGERIEAVRALGSTLHPKVAKQLLKFSRKEDDLEVLTVAFEVLRGMKPLAGEIAPDLAKRLGREAAAEAKRAARGDPGIRIDPRTGDADTHSAAGKARLLAGRRRSAMLAALLATVDTLEWKGVRTPPDLVPLLQDPSDDLVEGVLARLRETKDPAALPAVLALYRMYPTGASWETGAVVDLAGTNASAKAKWMVLFGHPDKQRARPRVHAALLSMLKAVTGQAFATPDALASFLASKDGKQLAKAMRRRR